MNVELLEQVKKQILAEPELFDMCAWTEEKSCGTAACICGWAVLLKRKTRVSFIPILTEGRELLELDNFQADDLFYHGNWPEPFRREYEEAMGYIHYYGDGVWSGNPHNPDYRKAAKVGARRIDHFIEHWT